MGRVPSSLLTTGIPNLDQVLGGGIPAGDVLLVIGSAGSGKTTFGLQVAFHAASAGRNVVYVSTVSEPPTRLIRHVRSLSFFDESFIGKCFFLLSVYPVVKRELDQVAEALIRAVKEDQASLVVIDGLMTIRDLHPEATELRTFIYELGTALSAMGCTTLLTSTGVEGLDNAASAEFTVADGLIELGMQDIGTQTVRTIRVRKMRGLAPLLGQHTLRVDGNGLTVFPRIESVFVPSDVGLNRERVLLGLSELDAMTSGGLPVGSTTVLAGALGTGKTLTCLQYVVEGVRRGEKGLIVGFRETPQQLIDKARIFGMDLETPIENGQVVIHHRFPVDLIADEVLWEIQREVERCNPRRLVLDSVDELEATVVDARRRRGVLAALVHRWRSRGVTSLVTKEVTQVVGPELDFADTPLAALAENLLLLRYVEFHGELYNIVSVLKMRETPYDHSIRQYTITECGLRVLARIETPEGVLTGIARLPSEARVKRRTRSSEGEERAQ